MLSITRMITPATVNGAQIKANKSMTIKGITYHNTGNSNANALQHAKAQAAGNLKNVAVHYYVDDVSIYQCLEDNEVGWHAGDGANGTGNTTTISIEVCEHTGINTAKANQNAAELGAYLLKKYQLSCPSQIYKHQDFANKYCPRLLIPIWDEFIAQITKEYQTLSSTGQSSSSVIYRVQVGAFSNKTNAENYVAKLKKDGYDSIITVGAL